MRKRGIVGIVVLSIITCGIYNVFATYQVYSDVNYTLKRNNTALTDILLSLITCGLWGIYCIFVYSKRLYDLGADDNSIVNVLLGIFSVGILAVCIMQSSINGLIDRSNYER